MNLPRVFVRRLLLTILTIMALHLTCFQARPSKADAQTAAPRQSNPELLTRTWSARWITAPDAAPFDYGVCHFRKTFELPTRPASFLIHVSGDNRYQLFVNGERVVWGPARGDLNHWRYETVDLAPHLKAGRNVLAAVVWNYAQFAPESQISWRTGFLLQGDTKAEQIVDTGPGWKAMRNEAYAPLHFTHAQMRGYFVAGPGDKVDGQKYPWGWETVAYDDSAWRQAESVTGDGRDRGTPREAQDGPNMWLLVPRTIPLMENTPERIRQLRQSSGASVPPQFPAQAAPFTVPAKTEARLLLDQAYLTTAYPELIVSGGTGAVLSLGYAEALFKPGTGEKGNRNEVEGREFIGYFDQFTADGGRQRLFRPLWWRTYRYLELKITTQDEPLVVEDLRGVYTGYPFERKAKFDAGSELLSRILDVGWRTARLDAHETYMDCPYYEQLQYVGDTRIQGLVSLYTSGDARLLKNAIALINDSRTAEGATMSRAPTRQQQYIPPFSLWWIAMVHDYWRYVDDPAFVKEMLPGVRAVLSFFMARQQASGSLGRMPWWNYVDWTPEWRSGVPPRDASGSSAPQDLQLLLALSQAAELETALGSQSQAVELRQAAATLRATIQQLYFDAGRRLYADTPEKKDFSQHSNVLAVLAGVSTGAEARQLINRIIADRSLVQCSYYFRHYLHSAVNLVGEGDRYPDLLSPWQAMLDRGLTTWAEKDDPTRSDCHAWSASPNYELFHTVLGIDSAGPGFSRVLIRPFPGKLSKVSGAIPHPQGEIAVSLEQNNGRLKALVSLPAGVTGSFVWRGQSRELKPGTNSLNW